MAKATGRTLTAEWEKTDTSENGDAELEPAGIFACATFVARCLCQRRRRDTCKCVWQMERPPPSSFWQLVLPGRNLLAHIVLGVARFVFNISSACILKKTVPTSAH